MSQRTIWAVITDLPATLRGRVLKISLLCFAVAVMLAAGLGMVTFRAAGGAGIVSMGAALLISLLSNVAGALPACKYLGRPEPPSAKGLLGGMIVRLVVLVLLAVPAALSDLLPRGPLLLWLAGSYFAMLMVETSIVANWISQHERMRQS